MKRPLAEASANADAGGGTRGGKAQQVDWRTVHSRTLARMCAAQRLQAAGTPVDSSQHLSGGDSCGSSALQCAHCGRVADSCASGRGAPVTLAACAGCTAYFCGTCSVLDYSQRATVAVCLDCVAARRARRSS